MSLNINTLLRTQRRLWGLTQKELARLLGIGSYEQLCRLENGKASPNLKTAIGSYIVFGIDFRNMFPKIWGEVEEHVIRRMYDFYLVVQHGASPKTKRKRELAERTLRRATGANRTKEKAHPDDL